MCASPDGASEAAATFETGHSRSLARTPLHKIVASYLRYYAQGPGHTARAKRLDVNHFIDFLADFRSLSRPEKLTVGDWDFSAVQRFIEHCLAKNESPSTVARRLATLKHMGRMLAERMPGFINPARDVKSPRVTALKPKALSLREVSSAKRKANIRLTDKKSFIRFRNATIFNFLLDTGIRADELRLLKRSQLDENLAWLKSVRTKGKRYRNVYISSKMRKPLQDYLASRANELKRFFPKLSKRGDNSLPLFISTYGCKPDKPETFVMGAKTLWRAIDELSPDVHLHPHLLRHSYAHDLLKHSSDIRLVSQALGHSDVKITMRYTERKDEEVARALEKARHAVRKQD